MTSRSERPLYAVTSRGLWALRDDISIVLDADIVLWPLCRSRNVDAYVGWGRRPSGKRALALAKAHARPVLTIEDGFLKSYAPGRDDPPHSFIVDRGGIYFDARSASDLFTLMDDAVVSEAEAQRSAAAMRLIRENQISKYNNAPLVPLSASGLPASRPFVLLVDQVAGDASIAGALADEARFGAMLEDARARYPDAVLAVRTHPAAGSRSLLVKAAQRLNIEIAVPGRMNPWPLLEAAEAVYTVSSQLGFEALLAGRKVHTFGVTYYSHRGLTEDHCSAPRAVPARTLEQVFHTAFIGYTRYLDLHDRSSVPIETALRQIVTVRDQRNRIGRRVYTGGLSPWKRRALDPFVAGSEGRAVHCRTFSQAIRLASPSGQIAVWGSARALPDGVPAVRFEDGFIRSRGLGANLALPCSLAMDGEHVYYDARGESRLERILATHEFDQPLLDRAHSLVDTIVRLGVSKYNVGTDAPLPAVTEGRLRILVPGQVEKDASIRFGSPIVRTNSDLVAAVRKLYPDAFVAYKEHPDVTTGLRSGGAVPVDADIIVREGDIKHWIGWCDRVETMTSLAGFEALIRHKPVGVHGIPFYAGWGLTDDRMAVARRTRRLTLDMLAAGTLILYPFYIHPLSAMPCTPEELVEEIALNRQVPTTAFTRLRQRISQSINRSAVRIRDGRN